LQYLFAGEGECLEALQTQAATLRVSDRVHFLGYRTDVFDLLSAVDAFLFPSLKEAMGISMIEAMAMAIPVVASRTGGIPEVVDAETGILTPPGNAPALAEAVDCLLEDPDQMRAMGVRARQRAEAKFSLAASADQVEKAYGVLLSSR
jgi:glycosyltransferase involved in cell wall biosynthesis